jgi:glycosyltransferase involved in cell wall biosynthesis
MKISVIVCTYNRDKYIRQSVLSLINQSISQEEYEIIIINNNSTDKTHLICQDIIKEHPDVRNIKYFIETNQGLSFARNRGIKESSTEIITYIDDDGIAGENFLELIIECFDKNQHYVGIGGKVIPFYESKEPEWLSYHTRMMVTHIDYGNESFKCFGKKYPPGCNMSYRKDVLIKSGGFNNALKWRVDDKYIFIEVQKISDEVYYIPSLKVDHHIDDERISDKSFDMLSKRLGEEEKLRVLSISKISYIIKVIEYLLKYFVVFIYYLKFLKEGNAIKGRYLIRMRWLAFVGLLK